MRIKQKGLCRGDGKVFIMYEVEHDEGQSVYMENTTKSGVRIPSKLIPMRYTECGQEVAKYVAVLPNIPAAQHLSFYALEAGAGDGRTACDGSDASKGGNDSSRAPFAKKTVRFEPAKWESRLNYRLNKDVTSAIRNYDEIWHGEQVEIFIIEVFPDEDAAKVRPEIYIPNGTFEDVDIKLYSGDMKPLDVEVVDLGSKKRSLEGGAYFTDCRVSFNVPNPKGYYLMEVVYKDHPERSNFTVIDPVVMKSRMGGWIDEHLNAVMDPAYKKWFGIHKATETELAWQRKASTELAEQPKFSIIVPLYKTPIPFFEDMAASVLEQTYGNWELILVNASPEDSALAQAVAGLAGHDERVVCVSLAENLGISLNTRAGLDAASGDYICFFDHDDVLEPDVLFEYAKAINNDPQIDLLYCDEDRLLPDGSVASPYFKPCFSIDLLRCNNYICHLLCIKRTLLDQLEPSPKKMDGAQDHDLTLKAVEKTQHVHHVPKVLYHWRAHENSTAGRKDSKPYATVAGKLAVQSHLDRLGIPAVVRDGRALFTYDVDYKVLEAPLVSVIIPSRDESAVLRNCITSIMEKTDYPNYEIVVVENNSVEPETFAYYEELTALGDPYRVKVVTHNEPFNFSALINEGARAADGEYLLFLNNDTEVINEDWMSRMVGICQRSDVGVVGARLWYPDDVLQHAGVIITGDIAEHVNWGHVRSDAEGYFAVNDKVQDLSAVTGACMMTKHSIFESVGGMDEQLAVAYNDIDYCLKVREMGLLVVFTPFVEMYHYESLSRGDDRDAEGLARYEGERALFKNRWIAYYANGDPYYSKHFKQDVCCNYRLPTEWWR